LPGEESTPAKKTKASRVLACLLAAIVGVPLLTEAGLRVVLGIGNPVLVTADSACGYTLKPDQDVHRFFKHTHINHWGMRSDDIAETPAPGTLRILFVGDSITYGTSHLDQKDMFTEILRRDLSRIVHRPVEVLNASAGGWAIDNELSYLRSRGTFGAKIVVIVLNSGDLTQPRADISGIDSSFFVQRPSTAIGELRDRFRPLAPRRNDAREKAVGGSNAVVRGNLEDLDDMKSLAERKHARFVLVYIPFRNEVPLPSETPRKALADWTSRNHVLFIDLTGLEAQYGVRRITFEGIHLNKKGNALAASYLMEHWPLDEDSNDRLHTSMMCDGHDVLSKRGE
jgi:hypothetical protein